MKKLLWGIWIVFVTLLYFFGFVTASSNDLLDEVFEQPKDVYEYVSEADAEDLFNTKLSIGIWNWDGDGKAEVWDLLWLNGSVISRFATLLLRLTVILWIPMLLYSGIKIMLSLWDEAKLKEAFKHVGMVALGLFLAMMSVAIVYLIISITKSNLWNI